MAQPDATCVQRYAPAAAAAGLTMIDLPCSCGAKAGEECRSMCTAGTVAVASRTDLVPIGRGSFAVRHCGRCQGSGWEALGADPTRKFYPPVSNRLTEPAGRPSQPCRCRADALQAVELRAADLAARAEIEENHGDHSAAARTRELAHRCSAYTLSVALRELDVPARPSSDCTPDFPVRIETPFGPVFASLDPLDADRVTVARVDGTHWQLASWPGARPAAMTVAGRLPELVANPKERLVWVVAGPTSLDDRDTLDEQPTVWFLACNLAPGLPCPVCGGTIGSDRCTGMRIHLDNEMRQKAGRTVYGLFPVPAVALDAESDRPSLDGPVMIAAYEAVRNAARDIARGQLVIS